MGGLFNVAMTNSDETNGGYYSHSYDYIRFLQKVDDETVNSILLDKTAQTILLKSNNGLIFESSAGATLNGSQILTAVTGVQQGVDNATTVVLTSAQLDTAYPTATSGFKVYCAAIAKIYEKTPTGWGESVYTQMP